MNAKTHWQHIYETKAPTQVSWYQEHAQVSMQFIQNTGIQRTGRIIDVGGGASTLVDDLLTAGFQHITVLDISATALQLARERLGARAVDVNWIEADITRADLPHQAYDVWHDRAVFHFLTQPSDRQRYINTVRHAVRTGGHVILATFAPDGPDRCSGLDVVRYSPESLHGEFGESFELVDSSRETHRTPFGTEQKFVYCYCRKY
jgi:2-polyprenyl-3-methyl-5-hydroxy-6-metoxy-1,4-benzoquinol methylase